MSLPIDDDDDHHDEAFERALFARRARALALAAAAPAATTKARLPDARAIVAQARAGRPRARLRFEIGAAPFVVAAAAACLLFRAGAFDASGSGRAHAATSARHDHAARAIARDPSASLGADDPIASAPDPRDPLACWANDGPASVGEYASRGEHAAGASPNASACVAEPAVRTSCSVE